MKYATAIAMLCLLAFSTPAAAFWTSDIGVGKSTYAKPFSGPQGAPDRHWRQSTGHYAKAHGRRSYPGGLASGNRVRYAACARYGRLQCGCTASMLAFGQVVNGLPLVSQWVARFRPTAPHVGAAAIWPGYQHVEIVASVNGDGTVDTTGSVGWSHVPIPKLRFVDPGASRYASR